MCDLYRFTFKYFTGFPISNSTANAMFLILCIGNCICVHCFRYVKVFVHVCVCVLVALVDAGAVLHAAFETHFENSLPILILLLLI